MSASLLLHLVQFSRQLILVTDEETNLIINVQEGLKQQGLSVHARSGPELPTPESWVELLEHLLELPYARKTLLETRLRHVLAKITQRSEPLVLLITQTDALSLEVFTVLLSLAEQNLSEQGALRLILFGSESLHDRLKQSALSKRYEAVSYVILKEETRLNSEPHPEHHHSDLAAVSSLKWHWIGAIGITALLVTVFANVQLQLLEENGKSSQIATAESNTHTAIALPIQPVEDLIMSTSQPIEPTLPPPQPENINPIPPPAASVQPIEISPPLLRESTPLPESPLVARLKPTTPEPETLKPKVANKPLVTTTAPVSKNVTPAYTLQIASLKNVAQAKALLKKHAHLKMLTVGEGAHRRYQIYMGPFKSRDIALGAQKKLHPELLALGPWLRKTEFKSVQLAKK